MSRVRCIRLAMTVLPSIMLGSKAGLSPMTWLLNSLGARIVCQRFFFQISIGFASFLALLIVASRAQGRIYKVSGWVSWVFPRCFQTAYSRHLSIRFKYEEECPYFNGSYTTNKTII